MHHNSTIFLQPLNFAKMSDDILYDEKFRWFFFSSQTRKGQAAPPTPTQHSVGNGLGHREMKNPRYRKIAEKHLQSKSARTWKKTLSVSQFGKNDWDGFWGRVSCETEKVWGVHSTLLLNVRWKQIHSYIYIYIVHYLISWLWLVPFLDGKFILTVISNQSVSIVEKC